MLAHYGSLGFEVPPPVGALDDEWAAGPVPEPREAGEVIPRSTHPFGRL